MTLQPEKQADSGAGHLISCPARDTESPLLPLLAEHARHLAERVDLSHSCCTCPEDEL